jgi:hypothetical protein
MGFVTCDEREEPMNKKEEKGGGWWDLQIAAGTSVTGLGDRWDEQIVRCGGKRIRPNIVKRTGSMRQSNFQ